MQGLCAEKPEHPQCEEYRRTVDLRQKAKSECYHSSSVLM